MQYKIFFEILPVKSALQKTLLPCNIKVNPALKTLNQPLRSVSQKQPLTELIIKLEKLERNTYLQTANFLEKSPPREYLKYTLDERLL